MVVARNGRVSHTCTKEVSFASEVNPSTKPISKRVGELPSIQYEALGGKTSSRKAQRFTTLFQHDTLPQRTTPKKTNRITYTSENNLYKLQRPARRVRFTLPDSDVATAGGGSSNKSPPSPPTSCRRPRASFSRPVSFSRRSNERRSNSGLPSVTAKRRTRDTIPYTRLYPDYSNPPTSVNVTCSPAAGRRAPPSGRYSGGTLSPTTADAPAQASIQPSPQGQALLRAARDSDDRLVRELLRNAVVQGIAEADLNGIDSSGRTVLSYIASNGSIDLLEVILQLPELDPNKADNEGNTPLHFAAQAGQIECLNCMLSRCKGIDIDSRNNLGFTPLMKAALQGRNKCAKLLLFAGANPTLRDNGRGFRADQWARFCGRYVCADVIEKHARQRLLERSTSYGHWGIDNEMGARVLMGKVVPVPTVPQQSSHGLKSKLRKVFRTSSGPHDNLSSARLVTQLTSAALCASSPVLPSGPNVPPVVKSLIRPLTVPRLQITLANNNGDVPNNNNNVSNATSKPASPGMEKKPEENGTAVKPARSKKK